MKSKLVIILFIVFFNSVQSQTYVFGSLAGNPIDAMGWNLSGNAFVNGSQIDITNPTGFQSGSIFYQTPINIGACNKWRVDFDFRIFDGTAADGLAFCFLTNYPTGFVSGGGVGIPASTNGLKIVFDTYNNGCGAKPEIQIFNGAGYDECSPNVISRQGNLPFIRNNNFQPASIIYDNGNITVQVNGITYLTGFVLVNYSGYMGFTASTGGSTDTHSIKNVVIYTNQAASNAGDNAITCVDAPVQIGTTPNPLYTYSWSPTFGLSDPTIANPTVTRSFPGSYTYTVSTSFTATPNLCPSTDLVTVTIPTLQTFSLGNDVSICAGSTTTLTATTSNGGDPIVSYSWSNNIDATLQSGTSISVTPTQNTTYTATATHVSGCISTDEILVQLSPNSTPNFTQVTPVCYGQNLSALPTVSNDGITGTWSPAIDNTTTTNYIFTPNSGQCATSAYMSITVYPNGAQPTFTFQNSYCAGASIPNLSNVSNEGISGSWNPSTINNVATTQYTFTPTSGLCFNPTTIEIEIVQKTLPVFNQVNPICMGSVLAPLPTQSNNGYVGSWSPAIHSDATTIYTFTPFANQCASEAEMTIVVNQRAIPQFDPIAPVCIGGVIAPLPTVSNDGFTGAWSPAIDNLLTTTYTFTPLSNQCAYERTLTIEVNELTIPSFATVPPLCGGTFIPDLPLSSDNGINGTWFPPINNNQSTTYLFTPNTGQCASQSLLDIEILPNSIVPLFDAIAPICEGSILSALNTVSNNGIVGSWSPALNNLQTTTYTFTPNTAQCAQPKQISIQVNPKVNPTFLQVAPICEGQNFTPLPLVSTNGILGTWSPSLNQMVSNTYVFTPNSDQCALGTQMSLVVHPVPFVSLVGGALCKDESTGNITKGFTLDTALDPYQNTIHWFFNNTFINGVYTSSYDAFVAGDYQVEVTNNTTGCVAVSTTASVIEKIYSTDFSTETTAFFDANPSILVLSSNVPDSIWYQLDSGPFQLSNQFFAVPHGLHTLTMFDDAGCLFESRTASIFSYPHYFTPNEDGINDMWHVFDAALIPDFSTVIFDRSGKFICNLRSYSQGWDGTYLGNKLPADDYWFVLYYTENGVSKTHRSHFSLKR
jgi:gliding motility-associated-like protein